MLKGWRVGEDVVVGGWMWVKSGFCLRFLVTADAAVYVNLRSESSGPGQFPYN